MPDYRLFGGVLTSDVEIPGLNPAPGEQPWWTLTRGEAPEGSYGDPLGCEEVEPGVHVTLYGSPNGLSLVFDDTGVFEISRDGRRITWTPPPYPDPESMGSDLLSRVFAVALHQDEFVTFQGSAVALGDAAVALLGPKSQGTPAAALVKSGGRLLADDMVAVWGRIEPAVVPHDVEGPVPLEALYLLAPSGREGMASVSRARLEGIPAARALLGQTKIGGLVGRAMRETLLGRMVELADRVPVYQLNVARDPYRTAELTGSLWSWHETPLMRAAAGGAR